MPLTSQVDEQVESEDDSLEEQVDSSIWQLRSSDGNIYTASDRGELESWAREGRVAPDHQIRSPDSDQWRRADEMFPFLVGLPTLSEPSSKPGQPGQDVFYIDESTQAADRRWVDTPHAVPTGYPAPMSRSLPPNNGATILVLGILGLPFFSCVILSLLAVILGTGELKAIREGRKSSTNQSLVQAGLVLGVIGLTLAAIMWCGGFMMRF